MASADMTRLMDNARIKLPGALDNAIKIELFSTLTEFFQDSNIWTEDIKFDVNPTTDTYLENPAAFTYELVVLDDGFVNRLMWVMDDAGRQQTVIMPVPGSVILQYAPTQAATWTARVAKTVVDPVDSEGFPYCPDWVVSKYGSDLLDGVLGRMMGQIAKPYSSPAVASVHLRSFKQAVNKAKAEAMHGNLYRGQAWRFPRAFARPWR